MYILFLWQLISAKRSGTFLDAANTCEPSTSSEVNKPSTSADKDEAESDLLSSGSEELCVQAALINLVEMSEASVTADQVGKPFVYHHFMLIYTHY